MLTPDRFKEIAHELHSSLAAMQVWIEVLGTAGARERASVHASARASVEAHARALDALLAEIAPDASRSPFASTATAAPKPGGPTRLDGIRVLLVDDEPSARGGLTLLLGSHGARVAAAASAAEARDRLARGATVDVIVLDVSMPDGGGVAALARIRALGGAARDVPAIAFTALAPWDPAVEAARESFDAVLTKPCEPEALLSTIARVVGER